MWWKQNRCLIAALVLGGIVRLLFLLVFFSDLKQDPDAYKQIAVNVRTLGVYGQAFGDPNQDPPPSVQPTAFRPPLYPLALSCLVTQDAQGKAVVSLFGVASLHFVVGLATIYLAWYLGRQFSLPKSRCLLLAIIVACDPIALRQSGLPMTETFAIFCALLGVCVFAKTERSTWFFLGAGALLGVFALCRPTFLIWAGLIFVFMTSGLLLSHSEGYRSRLLKGTVFALGVFLVLTPWIIRNYQQFGKPIFATSHGGYTIFLGNNDSFYDYLYSGRDETWNGEKELRAIVLEIRKNSLVVDEDGSGTRIDEVKKDKLYYQRALEVISRRPGDFAYACCVRVIRFWSLIPRSGPEAPESDRGWKQQLIRYGSAVWYFLLFSLALVGIYRLIGLARRNDTAAFSVVRVVLPSILLVVAFQGLHLLYWSNMRMRAPLIGVIALLAVIGLCRTEWLAQKFLRDRIARNSSERLPGSA